MWADTVVSDSALTSCIQEIRQALRDNARKPRYLETVHKRGVRFIGKVVSNQLSVVGQTEVASSQHSVVSSQEEGKKTEQAEDFRLQAEGPPSPSPSSLQPEAFSLSQSFGLNTQDLLFPVPPRSWPRWSLVWLAVVLLIGVSTTALYRVSFLNPQSTTHNQETLALPDKPSLVVLPFQNLSGDPTQDYFSDGLTDVLTGDLSKISSLFVIARNSAFTYKGKAVKVQDVGREMGVRYVLEGSVLKADNQVRITTQLIDATTGYHLWSEHYDRPLQNILTLQDEIVQKIVTTLKLQVSLQEHGQSARKHTDNLEAYDAFLRGMGYLVRETKTEVTVLARQMFERAIALDPQYAEAYAFLGGTYWVEWVNRWSVDLQTLEQAFAFEQKAVALDDSLPTAHALLSLVYALRQQYEQALTESARAIALDPNNAHSYYTKAMMMNWTGRPEEALQAVRQAMRLNPRYPSWYLLDLGWAYNGTGHYAEAVAASKEAINRSPTSLSAHCNLTVSYLSQWVFQMSQDPQILEQALAVAQRTIAFSESNSGSHLLLGSVYLWQKRYEQALAEMERAIALDPNEASGYGLRAVVLVHVGRSKEALQMVEEALGRTPLMLDGHLIFIGEAYALAGKLEEAIDPLQRYLTHYPNFLGAHLDLVGVYSELGREAEARAEAAEVLRLNPQFSLEVHKQRAPIKDPVVLERDIAALRKAGLK